MRSRLSADPMSIAHGVFAFADRYGHSEVNGSLPQAFSIGHVLTGDTHMNWLRSFGNGRALLRPLAAFILGAAAALSLYACRSSTDEMGVVGISLTDTAGDFLSYTVDVTSLTLTKADGTVVQALPLRTRVDFARLVDLTEFVTAVTIPSGNYVSATLNLDYANADIQVDDGTGVPVPPVPPANIRDSQGVQVTTLSMSVKLDPAR